MESASNSILNNKSILGDLQSLSFADISMPNIVLIVLSILFTALIVLLKLKPDLAEKIPFANELLKMIEPKKQVCFMGETCDTSSSTL